MPEDRELCHFYDDLLDPGLMERLGLDRETFTPAFERLRDYWMKVLGPVYGKEYVMCAALQLGDVLKTPEEWVEVGKYLADATAKTFGNGSHQFVAEAVPALIERGIVRSKDELKRGIDLLVTTIHPHYAGGIIFSTVSEQIMRGEITTLDGIREKYPPPKYQPPNNKSGSFLGYIQ